MNSGDSNDIWTYPESVGRLDLAGFRVEAVDGEIGTVDETSHDAGYFVVDIGTWIFGKKVLLPGGVIERVDRDDERVHVTRTKGDIERAPEYDEDRLNDEEYRAAIGHYYAASAQRDEDSA